MLPNLEYGQMATKRSVKGLKSKMKPKDRDYIPDVSASIGVPLRVPAETSAMRYDETGTEFFEELYLALNPDVESAVKAGLIPSGVSHWQSHGRVETLKHGSMRSSLGFRPPARPVPSSSLSSTAGEGLDLLSYLYVNPDVLKVTNGDVETTLAHWVEHGRLEGRAAPGIHRRPLRHVSFDRLSKRPLGFNIFGAFAATTGLGTAARAMAKAVKATGFPFDLNVFDLSTGELRPAENETRQHPKYRVNLILANADQMSRVFSAYSEEFFDDAYNVALWQWELASPRADAFYAFDGLDEVWTNSAFQHNAISSISPVPVTKIYIPVVAPQSCRDSARREFGIAPDRFVFLMLFDIGSTSARKNPLAAVQAFRSVQQEYPNTHLVLKYHGVKFEQEFQRELLSLISGAQNITVISSELGLKRMDDLRECCDCLISAHRSEGFGLNIAEFLSLGKPVIATAYSGNVDFFDESVGFPVDYTLTELTAQSGPYQPGFIWAEPSMTSLAAQIRRVLNDPDEVCARGAAASHRVRQMLSIDAVRTAIKARLDLLQLDQTPPMFARFVGQGDYATRRALASSPHAKPTLLMETGAAIRMSIVVPVYNVSVKYLSECVQSVLKQSYPLWELCVCDDCSTSPDTIAFLLELRGASPMIKIVFAEKNGGIAEATNRAIELATGEFIVFLDNDDLLSPNALEEVAKAISLNPHADVLYSDEEKIDELGTRIDHYYKPDWSPDHLESVMYVLHMLVVRKRLLLSIGGLRPDYDGAQDYDLMLRCSRVTDRICHIPQILYSWRAIPGSAAAVVDAKPIALENGLRALSDHARQKYGPLASVEPGLLPGTFRLRRPLAYPPEVSLLILTGNARMEMSGRGEVILVENLVASILEKTDYPNYKIIVIDNSSLEVEQKQRLSKLGVEIRNFESSGAFNYAAKANFAMREAPTDSIVLMNDDMEVIRCDWLTALVELSSDPGIGAVGGRLLHMDGTIQHVGTVLGVNTGAAHVYHSFPRDFIGYNGFTHLIRNYSAVTAACLATRRSVAAQVGWMDESLAIDFNDIDFCLRITAAGYRVTYTPYAELYHYEGVSARRTTQNPAEIELFCRRWAPTLQNDPYYNPNLTRNAIDFSERSDPGQHF